jgi:hypothetical protein
VNHHAAALGDALGLSQIGIGVGGGVQGAMESGAREETERDVLLLPGVTKVS